MNGCGGGLMFTKYEKFPTSNPHTFHIIKGGLVDEEKVSTCRFDGYTQIYPVVTTTELITRNSISNELWVLNQTQRSR